MFDGILAQCGLAAEGGIDGVVRVGYIDDFERRRGTAGPVGDTRKSPASLRWHYAGDAQKRIRSVARS